VVLRALRGESSFVSAQDEEEMDILYVKIGSIFADFRPKAMEFQLTIFYLRMTIAIDISSWFSVLFVVNHPSSSLRMKKVRKQNT
jgi:hypothetical protein